MLEQEKIRPRISINDEDIVDQNKDVETDIKDEVDRGVFIIEM